MFLHMDAKVKLSAEIPLKNPCEGRYFLVAGQESTQRSRLGGGTDREVYRYFLDGVTPRPRLQAVLPQGPLPAPCRQQ